MPGESDAHCVFWRPLRKAITLNPPRTPYANPTRTEARWNDSSCFPSTRDCTLVRERFHRDGWVYEEKVDGWRIIAYKDGHRVRLLSRHGRDHPRRFRDIVGANLIGGAAWPPAQERK
jgi:hypothetical protein